jgi:arsenate reductase (thioredoxin)
MSKNRQILFVCVENSSRSQMAEGFARAKGLSASSAGTFPANQVNPLAVQAMEEEGINISESKPKLLTEELIEKAQLVVLTDATLQDRLPKNLRKKIGKKLVIWSIPDPQGQPIEVVRFVRNEIRGKVDELANTIGSI